MEDIEGQEKAFIRVSIIVAVVVVILILGIFTWHSWTEKRNSSLVLHSGVTYTGPTPTPNPNAPAAGKFSAPEGTPWKEVKGKLYSYVFSVPETLNLVRFDKEKEDPYDIYAIAWNNINPGSAVLIGVDNLQANDKLKPFVNQPKIAYVEFWWKQFGGLTGVQSITPFTNSKGTKGYKAKFLMGSNPSPTDDVFFEIASKKNLVIHLANGPLDPKIFDKIVDSVAWDDGKASSPAAKSK